MDTNFKPVCFRLYSTLSALVASFLFITSANATPTQNTSHGALATSFDGSISNTDLISGLNATELPGDTGWHPANTNPVDKLPAFTDGFGVLGSGLIGLLNDFPVAGNPTKK